MTKRANQETIFKKINIVKYKQILKETINKVKI